MNQCIKLATALAATLAVAACNAGGVSNLPATISGSSAQPSVPAWEANHSAQWVCPDLGPGHARCLVLLEKTGVTPDVAGWTPIDFQTRYNLPSTTNGWTSNVAIVDAYDNPNAASDLAKYRSYFGLTKATFFKYNQSGSMGPYPSPDKRWGVEEDLDIEMVSAVCEHCGIFLIEANSSSVSDLEQAEVTATDVLDAQTVSNSWGCGTNTCADVSYFNHPHHVYLASSGDGGYGTQGPAALGTIVAVGGTVLSKSGSTYSETTWSGTGSGCATGIAKPSWQHDKKCSSRTENDVSAVAQHVAMYDTYKYGGWITVAGTSIASPLIAGVYGLAGNAVTIDAPKKLWTQTRKQYNADMHDVKTGSNGTCGGTYLCEAKPGYDGPTGWGTPNGINAF